ncbi:MAG: amidohydrolase family protein, partial [Candidatus Poribacteria bacterium]|nr:amidohydrolase family protein [Candidatus Poribacteria bacterium]
MASRVPRIDTDIHPVVSGQRIMDYLPEPFKTRYRDGSRGPGHLGYWNPNGVMRSDTRLPDGSKIENKPESLAKYLFDEYDFEYGILNPGGALHAGLSPDPDFSATLCAATNDVLLNDWHPVDDRFRLSLCVSPGDPELAAKEIHRLGGHPAFVQVLMPSGARFPYGQRYYHPIYAAAVEYGLPVAIHPGSEGVGVSGAPTAAGYPSTYFEWHTGLVGSYMAHLISLVTEG